MKLADILKADSKLFLKSVYGPVDESWPAMSYTSPSLKTHLDRHYRSGVDFILLTGTSGKETDQEYRGRLLSVLAVDLTRQYRTEEIVPRESWQRAQENYPGQWEFSLGVLQAWKFISPPYSADVLPASYPLMGQHPYRGSVRELGPQEHEMILGLEISAQHLPLQPAMKPALTFQALLSDRVLNEESVRVAGLILNRVDASNSLQIRVAQERTAMPSKELLLMVAEHLQRTPLRCALCGGVMLLRPENKLLQVSPDRKDSASGSYGPENFQLAHLGCNLAKNNATEAEFHAWLEVAAEQLLAGRAATDTA